MQAGKNRKRDLELLTEVYSSSLLGEGMKDYYAAQEQETGSSGYQQARMAPNMGTETHTGYPAEAEDQNPVENYEGEEETTQEKSVRLLHRGGWKRSELTPKGNVIMTKADQPDAQVGTDGLINGKDYKLFLSNTGEQGDLAEDEQDDQSLPEPEDTGVNADQNRGSWGSAAFGNESEEGHEDHEAMLIGRRGGCGDDDSHGSSDPTHNPRALGGMVDIIAKAIADQNEDENENTEDDDLLKTHMGKVHGRDTDDADQRYFKARDKQEDDAAKKQGFNPDENAEDAAEAMRADERENKKRLRAQDAVARIYGFNPDADEEDSFDDFDDEDTDSSDEAHFRKIDPEQWAKAKQAGWSGGATEDEEYDEDREEVDREKRYKHRWGKDLDDERDREGSSNAGAYTDVDKDDFCGPAGGAAPGTYPVNTIKRARAALGYAHNAKDPDGIDDCVKRKYPSLDKDEDEIEKKESYFKSKGDKAMTQLMESYQDIINNGKVL